MNRALTREEVLQILVSGGSLWYFYLEGGIGLHDSSGNPIKDCYCPAELFSELDAEGRIKFQQKIGGWPFYANNAKIAIYVSV